MSTSNLKLHKGENIAIKGVNYQVASTTNVRVRKGKEDIQEAEAVANHRTDVAEPIDKKIVLAIIQRDIEALQKKENSALFYIGADDLLFELDEADIAPQASIAEHISIVAELCNLQELLKEIKAL